MLRNYLKTAWRTLRRNKIYTLVNVGGLAVSMAACLLIGLYVSSEFSYDGFHHKSERLMVIGAESGLSDGQGTPYPLAEVLSSGVPEVRRVVRTRGTGTRAMVRRAHGGFEREQRVLEADSAFFEVFSFPLLRGSAQRVLDVPGQAVITRQMAHAFFGEADPLGRPLTIEREDETRTVTVAGVAEAPPPNSTIQFDMVVPIGPAPPGAREHSWSPRAWGSFSWHTYALVKGSPDAEALAEQVRRVAAPHAGAIGLKASAYNFFALPMTELYFSDYYEAPGFKGQRRYAYLFGTVALVILLIAGINYVNLFTAQGEGRAKEVGVRRAVGAQREQIAGRFLGETALLSLAALAGALVLVRVTLPGFNTLLDTSLSVEAAHSSRTLLGLVAFVLAVTVAAGAYPAFALSRFRPVEALGGRSRSDGTGGRRLQRGLVVFQFAVAVGLMLCAAVLYQQLRFMQAKNLGFEGAQVVTVAGLAPEAARRAERAVRDRAGIQHVTVSHWTPDNMNVGYRDAPRDISPAARTQRKDDVSFKIALVDPGYVETMGMQLLAGRPFRKGRPTDRRQGYLLNRAAAEIMGWTPESAAGKPFLLARSEGTPAGEVLGVVENFHTESLRSPIEPIVMMQESPRFSSSSAALVVRLAPDRIEEGLASIETAVRAQTPDTPFEYAFLDDTFDAMYRSEARIAQIFGVFAALAVAVACLGLFGLSAFAAERRTKEIAIRKTLGASTRRIVALLSKEFTALVSVALLVGLPVAWWGASTWLDGFAYRIDLGPELFLFTAAAALIVAGTATSYHALRAAWTNPAEALRDE